MKNLIYIISLLTAIFIISCDHESYRPFSDTQVGIESSNVIFEAKGGSGTIVVSPSEQSFTATSDKDWCTLSTSGNTITVTVSANVSMDSRTALVTIRSNEKVNYVPVSQNPIYIKMDTNEALFLGKGGTVSIPYSSEIPVTVSSEASWATPTVSNENVVITVSENPKYLESRTTRVKLVAGNNYATIIINVVQSEGITSYEVPPNITSINNFLNLKNNGTTSSRYKITTFSAPMAKLYNGLKIDYPLIKEIRIEAPRSSYKLSVIWYNVIGTTESYLYWNVANGLTPISGSKSKALFALSGDTYGGTPSPYTNHANYTKLRAIFASTAGFTIIPDTENTFWFRSIEDPRNYFKVEPTTW